MNKKGEILISGVFVLVLLAGILIFEFQQGHNNFIGDSSTMVAYRLDSKNPQCDFSSIKIDRTNIRFFQSIQELIDENFILNHLCD